MPISIAPVEVMAPVLMSEYLREVALTKEPFKLAVNLGSLLRSAGFVRATELSLARVN
jgi:hypothetical protein